MASMSRLFILFLIALLPLRGWTAERMAVQMAGMPVAVQLQSQEPGMSAECALHMQMALQRLVPSDQSAAVAQAEPAATSHAGHQGCQSCQLCMPLAALDIPALLALLPAPQMQPQACSSAFASADAARCAKPPIF